MGQALWRKGFADLRSRPLQTFLLFLVITSVTAILMLALTVPRALESSFTRAHEAAHGAHLWVSSRSAEAAAQLAQHPSVVEVTPVYTQVRGALVGAGEPDDVVFLGLQAERGGISPAVIVAGRWFEESGRGEAVITRSLAHHAQLEVGDVVQATTVSASAPLTVVGVAIDTSFAPYPQSRPGVVFVAPATAQVLAGGPLQGLTPREQGQRRADFTVGVRIEHPEAAADFWVEARRGREETLYAVRTWLHVRDVVAVINEGPGIIVGVFSFFGLLAAGIILASAITGHVLAQTREVGILKASGFSPRHITLLLLSQQLGLGFVAALSGALIGTVATPAVLDRFAELLYAGVAAELDPLRLVAVVGGVGVLIVIFTLVPAWRAGRISTVDALTRSRLAQLARWLRLPPVLVFALKDVFARKTRAWLTVAAVIVVTALGMVTLMFHGMFTRFTNDPASLGAWPFELQVERLAAFGSAEAADGHFAAGTAQPMAQAALRSLVESHPEVAATLTNWEMSARVAELDMVIPTFVVAGPVEAFDFRVIAGRMFAAPHEAVIGLGLAQAYGLAVGDQVTVLLRQSETRTEQVPLTVVGTYVSGRNLGRVLMYGADTLPNLASNDFGSLNLKLASGVDASAFAATLVEETGGLVMVTNVAEAFQVSLEDEYALMPLMLTLNGILLALAVMNILIGQLFTVRERTREFGILKTVGFAPRQLVLTVIAGAAVLAILGVVLGAPVGYVLTRLWMTQADVQGLPSDLVQLPSPPWLALLAPLATGLAVLGAALPARRAAGLTVSAALRFE